MLISIYEDNYAFYDAKENKIKFGYGDRSGSTSSIPEGMKLTNLCITDDYLCFILDKTHLLEVGCVLNQSFYLLTPFQREERGNRFCMSQKPT
jgi:hypothetical protein